MSGPAKRIASVVSVLVLGVALYFAPEQLQTQMINPALPNEAELRALGLDEEGPESVGYILSASQEWKSGSDLAHPTFVITWADGRQLLIDLGMDRETAEKFERHFRDLVGAGKAQFHGTVADQLGDDLARVSGVALTHLHEDHVQGVQALCQSAKDRQMLLLQTDTQREKHNSMTSVGAEMVEQSCLERITLEGMGVLTHDDFPGIGLVKTGGHTPGSTLIAVAAKGHLWLFAGDINGTKANLESNTSKPLIYTTFIIPENRRQNRKIRRWLNELDANEDVSVVLSHDLLELQRTPLPRIGG